MKWLGLGEEMGSKRIKAEYLFLLMGLISSLIVYLWWLLPNGTSLMEKIIDFIMFTVFGLTAIFGILYPLQNYPFFSFLYSVLKYVVIGIRYIIFVIDTVFGPLFNIGILIVLQSILWSIVLFFINTGGESGIISAYIVSVCTIVILSYRGVWIINFFNTYFLREKDEFNLLSNSLTLRFFSRLHFRRRAYEFTIALFIFSTIESLIDKDLFPIDIWSSFSDASLAILLTFTAIDSYIVNFMPSVIKEEREQLDKILSK